MPRGRFVNRPYKALYIKDYLLASSIATATVFSHTEGTMLFTYTFLDTFYFKINLSTTAS
jgi:hypothetical protein